MLIQNARRIYESIGHTVLTTDNDHDVSQQKISTPYCQLPPHSNLVCFEITNAGYKRRSIV